MDLTEFCGGEEFFNGKEFMNSSNPDFSICFQKLVFDLVPCGYLWLFAIPYFIATKNNFESSIAPSRLFFVKLVLTVLLWGLAWADFGRSLYELVNSIDLSYANAVSPMVVGLAMATAGFFLNLDRLRGVRSSGFLTCYWFLYLISWIFVFKSKVELLINNKDLSTGEIWRCVTFFMSFTCVLTHVILSLFVDSPPTTPPRDADEEDDVARFEERLSDDVRKKLCPEYSSSFLSRMIFEWFSSMIMLGYKRPLVDNDLWKLNKVDRCGHVSKYFEKKWKEEVAKHTDDEPAETGENNRSGDQEVLITQPGQEGKKKKGPSLLKVMVGTFGPYFLVGSFLKVINDILTFVSPQLLSGLISFTKNKTAPMWQGYVLAILMFVAAIFQTIVLQQYFHVCFVVGMRVRSAIIATIYKKALHLSNSARKTSTVGEVVNLMSVDAQRFMDLMSYLNMIWSAPFQLILSLYFLWMQLGPSVLAGVAVMVLLIPFNGIIAKKAHSYQVEQMKHKDERIKLMNEILNGIKVLKMYAWEVSFKDKIKEIRNKELQVLKKAAYLNAAASFTWVCSPVMVALSSFAVYVLSDNKNVLDAQTAFVSISLFNILRFPLIMLPVMISSLVQASVSLARVSKFLSNDELDTDNVQKLSGGPGPAISFENGTFSWSKDETPVLSNIDVSVPKGSLVAVVGQVGSGKSSLISAILGEMEKIDGNVSIQGSVAYVAQQAWIQNLTVRNNILFGKELDVCKYQQTIEACELKEDFEMLPASDETEIGERGINLSGGQKQRVSLARAVYSDADVYLFDDPLSAVDSHVGKNIFENVLGPCGVLNGKTRVLVTHGVSFLPQVDKIVVLVNGKISEVGGYNELLEKNEAFAEFLRNYAQNEEEIFEDEDVEVAQSPVASIHGEEDVEAIVGSLDDASATSRRRFERQHSRKSVSESVSGTTCKPRLRRGKSEECKLPEKKEAEKDNLITTEEAETGNVRMAVFLMYMKSVGFMICLLIFVAYTLQNAAQVYSNIWLADWTNDPVNPDGTQNKTTLRLTVYGLLGLGQAIVVMISGFSLTFGAVIAARLLHEKMLIRVLRAPMAFFDTTPLGRIINRFSKDIYLVDEVIPRSLSGFLRTLFSCLSTFFVIIYSTPIFGVIVIPILILYYFVQRFYIRTSRQLKRLESISRSPIYSHFSETMTGVSTIRAYGLDKSFMRASELKVDTNQMAYFPNIVSNRWLALRLELVGNLVVLFAAIFAVNERNKIDPSIVGLSISYSLQITSMLNWMVRMASELETNIVAVERVDEYSNIVQEAPLETQGLPPSRDWPMIGSIRFEDYSTRYRPELDLVVKDINVVIQGGEKVGVVGRTGAGKSSLTLSLFRIIEAASGRIRIDGRTIADVGLHDLRKKISIIPQDPVLFSGTLRMNLDPFDAYTDDQLWDALTHSHLKAFVQTLPKKLEHDVAEGGENLSVGQRQLVCLARALLRKSKILVLDEATAAVDLETDDLIQATIRSQFATSTTFTIAHRLNTIMDSSRVIVLDAGKIVEVDTPENLLELKGIFYSMAKDAGLTT